MAKKKLWRRLLKIVVVILVVVLIAAVGLWFYANATLKASLPQLEGTIVLEGLSEPVRIDRDANGVPSIHAANRTDAAKALGFLHAQERFFQMDILRRLSSGRLSELVGGAAISTDERLRAFQCSAAASRAKSTLDPAVKAELEAYTAGVNQGLAALGSKPFEYHLLRTDPSPWELEDMFLVTATMAMDLQDEQGSFDLQRAIIRDSFPPELVEFLDQRGSDWDSPLEGGVWPAPQIPGADVFDLQTANIPSQGAFNATDEVPVLGSNNWAVGGALSPHGAGIVANDMHLNHGVPNVWYRVDLHWKNDDGSDRRVTGVSLPGTPSIVAGSNGSIAWGFTNTYGDWTDVVVLDMVDDDTYRTAEGEKQLETRELTIQVKGGEPVVKTYRSSEWGPVIGEDEQGRPYSVLWTILQPGGLNGSLILMSDQDTMDDALALANACGIPAQNFTVAHRDGSVAWTIAGRVPRRLADDGRLPRDSTEENLGWQGWLDPAEVPRIVNPANHRIWTANSRVASLEQVGVLGWGGYALGSRQAQIRDRLLSKERFSEADLLAIQLDDEALFLSRWRDKLLDLLTDDHLQGNPSRAEIRDLAKNWSGYASIDDAGYTMVRGFRTYSRRMAMSPFVKICEEKDPNFSTGSFDQIERTVWTLITEKPKHLLDPAYDSWDALLLAAVDEMVENYTANGQALNDQTWGSRNTLAAYHPLSFSIPIYGARLNYPSQPLPGDIHMPRVQGRGHGASERFVVAPGKEESGIFHMPGGQSGHPLSPFYKAGHDDWVKGEPSPFLPGEPVYTLTLQP